MANADVFDASAPSKLFAWFLLGTLDRTILYLYHVDTTPQSAFSLLIQHRSFVHGPVLDILRLFSSLIFPTQTYFTPPTKWSAARRKTKARPSRPTKARLSHSPT
jgi:hypothetical protein